MDELGIGDVQVGQVPDVFALRVVHDDKVFRADDELRMPNREAPTVAHLEDEWHEWLGLDQLVECSLVHDGSLRHNSPIRESSGGLLLILFRMVDTRDVQVRETMHVGLVKIHDVRGMFVQRDILRMLDQQPIAVAHRNREWLERLLSHKITNHLVVHANRLA
ncbi:MAG: hypothetical protein AAF743_11775 [Planctomycetota bacterium]